MSFSSGKLFSCALPLSAGEKLLTTKPYVLTTTKGALPLLQARSEGKQEPGPPKVLDVSRRDVMLSLPAATLAAVTFFSVEPAEARIVKPEIRKKIQEKFKKLREKAGLVEPKTNEEKKASTLSNSSKKPDLTICGNSSPLRSIRR